MEPQKHKVWDVKNIEEYKSGLLEDVFIKSQVPETIKTDLLIKDTSHFY